MTVDRYDVQIVDQIDDPEWEAFVAQHPGGSPVQTGRWAHLKAVQGLSATRLVVREQGCVTAGAQILIRKTSLGRIGYVARGPLLGQHDPDLAALVMGQIHAIARAQRLLYVTIQPATTDAALAARLPEWGYWITPLEIQTSATLQIDLTRSSDDLLAAMRRETRYNINRSRREGITVREGRYDDLPAYVALLGQTGRRQRFSPYSLEYYQEMWRQFAPPGILRLFVAEVDGEPVAAATLMCFGDTVMGSQRGWSGAYPKKRPNEGLDWAMMTWAKAQGYRTFDLGGISREAAEQLLKGEPLPDDRRDGPLAYKLGFRGQPVLTPRTYAHVPMPLLTAPVRLATAAMARQGLLKRLIGQLRTG